MFITEGCLDFVVPPEEIWEDPDKLYAFFRQLERVGVGELRYSFRDYMNLSEWHLVDRDRYTVKLKEGKEEAVLYKEYIITIDGKQYESGDTVKIDGKRWTIKYSGWGALWAFDEDSDFSQRWYAKASPWEDFAEAYATYLYLPERLIKNAPEKFLHLELEFKVYQDNEELLEKAE